MATDNRETTPVKFVGYPDGPKVFVPELGCETPTFNMEPTPVERNQHRDIMACRCSP
jgi:hypothetical protein